MPAGVLNRRSPGDVAVHHVGTRLLAALHQRREERGLVDVEQQEDEHAVHQHLEEQAEEVGPPQAPPLLARVAVQRDAVVPVLQPVFALALLPVGHVQRHQEGRAGDEDELQGPEARVGDGVVVVVADVVAAGLPRVAVKVLLLVAPHLLAGHQEDQEAEDEDDGEPDASERRGVFVDPAEEALEEGPVHGVDSDPPPG